MVVVVGWRAGAARAACDRGGRDPAVAAPLVGSGGGRSPGLVGAGTRPRLPLCSGWGVIDARHGHCSRPRPAWAATDACAAANGVHPGRLWHVGRADAASGTDPPRSEPLSTRPLTAVGLPPAAPRAPGGRRLKTLACAGPGAMACSGPTARRLSCLVGGRGCRSVVDLWGDGSSPAIGTSSGAGGAARGGRPVVALCALRCTGW